MQQTLQPTTIRRRSVIRRGDTSAVWRYIALIVLAFVTLAPIFVMFATSLKTPVEIQSRVPRWIFTPTFSNYQEVIVQYRMIPFLTSSLVIGLGSTVLTLLTAGMAAFALARMRFAGRGIFAQTTLIIRMIPPAVIAVAVIGFWISWGIGDFVEGVRFTLPNRLGRGDFLDGSQLGLMLFYTALNLPFSVWLLFGFIQQIPVELEEAAIVDGANIMEVLFKIIFPLMGAGFAVSAIFTFRIAWNEFILALFLTSRYTKTLPVFASEFIRDDGVLWGQMMAVGSLIAIPPLIITFFAARQIIQGMTAGAVKG
ncbi:MAG: carbohydrate ABC transporter permease [Deinococcota bacterium]